jgi:pimeloyl-ACP methyl ester carboxylesterase
MSLTGQTLRLRGLDFNVLVRGQGPDVLLVHGFPDSNAVWRHQIPPLVEAGFRVIAPDLRGFGDSSAPPGRADYKADKIVGDLIGILDALDVQSVRLVAHDWGAVIGWLMCMRHPERIERYVAMSVGHPTAYAHGGVVQKLKGYYILFFQVPGVAEQVVMFHDWWLWRRILRDDPELARWKADLSRPGRLTAAMSYYRANIGMILPRDLPKVTVPVMGIWGSGDIALAERQMIASRLYVTGPWRYERVDGGGHWLQLQAPERVTALLLDYLR